MGSANSAESRQVAIDVALDKPEYFAGDVVRGFVLARVKERVRCSGVDASLECNVVTASAAHGPGDSDSSKRDQAAFDPVRFRAAEFQGEVLPGDYQFVFSLQLPANCPPSVVVDKEKVFATVTYKVKVKFRRPELLKRDLVKEYVFRVFSQPPPTVQPASALRRAMIPSLCCWQLGTIEIQATTNKDAYQAGDTVEVTYSIANHSKYLVTSVEAHLNEKCLIKHSSGDSSPTSKERMSCSMEQVKIESGAQSNGTIALPFVVSAPSCVIGRKDKLTVKHQLVLKVNLAKTMVNAAVKVPLHAYGYYASEPGAAGGEVREAELVPYVLDAQLIKASEPFAPWVSSAKSTPGGDYADAPKAALAVSVSMPADVEMAPVAVPAK